MIQQSTRYSAALIGIILFSATADMTTTACAEPPNINGIWHNAKNPKSALKLFLKQDGYRLSGYFSNNKKRWKVEGFVTDSGAITMVRWIPVSELRNTDPEGWAYALKQHGDTARKGFLVAWVTMQLNAERRKIDGQYDIIGIEKNGKKYQTSTKPKDISLQLRVPEPLLVDKDSRFHRLIIVGPGNEKEDGEALYREAAQFYDLLSKNTDLSKSDPPVFISSKTPRSLAAIKSAISNLAKKAMPGDQVLIHISAHGWGGAYSKDLSKEYAREYQRLWKDYYNKNTTILERAIISGKKHGTLYDKWWKKNPLFVAEVNSALKKVDRLEKDFAIKFITMITKGKVKKVKDAEFFMESVWLTDPNNNFRPNKGEWLTDHDFAELVKPIVQANNPLTVVVDACFGGGFGDNLKSYANVHVIGLGTKCPLPGPGQVTVTGTIANLINNKTNSGKKSARVKTQDAIRAIRNNWPNRTGSPPDNINDLLRN